MCFRTHSWLWILFWKKSVHKSIISQCSWITYLQNKRILLQSLFWTNDFVSAIFFFPRSPFASHFISVFFLGFWDLARSAEHTISCVIVLYTSGGHSHSPCSGARASCAGSASARGSRAWRREGWLCLEGLKVPAKARGWEALEVVSAPLEDHLPPFESRNEKGESTIAEEAQT